MKVLLLSRGTRTFSWFWLGQTVSLFGTHLTAFALGVWLYQETGRAMPLALSMLATFTPRFLLSPLAGMLVDRLGRKRALLLSDFGQALCTAVIGGLLMGGWLQIWMIYLLLALSSTAGALEPLAQQATVSVLVPREHLGRANGLLSLGEGIGGVGAPLLAGWLVPLVGVGPILWIDVSTFLIDLWILLSLSIPNPSTSSGRTRPGPEGTPVSTLVRDFREGWRYLLTRPGLRALIVLFAFLQMVSIFITTRLVTPLVLARTGGDTLVLGLIFGAFSLGQVLGSLTLSLWGGPRNRIHGIVGSMILIGLFNQVLFGLSHSPLLWTLAYGLGGFLIPIQSGCSRALWQAKVAPELQGRVFGLRTFGVQWSVPLGLLLVGWLPDSVFRPAIQGGWGRGLAPLVGDAPGAEFALTFLLFGGVTVGLALGGYLHPSIRAMGKEP